MPTVYITAPTDRAAEIAEHLVEQRVAACVNRVPCQSTYRWEGELVTDEETILLAKTTVDRYGELVETLRAVHPYETPCIERFDEIDVAADFADWVESACSPAGPEEG